MAKAKTSTDNGQKAPALPDGFPGTDPATMIGGPPPRAKVMIYGDTGVWKTSTAIGFPSVFYADSEGGAHLRWYLERLQAANGRYDRVGSLRELRDLMVRLARGDHPYITLVVDNLTVLWERELDSWSDRLKTDNNPTGTGYMKHREATRPMLRRIFDVIDMIDMNVVLICQQKAVFKEGEIDDWTFDCDPDVRYWFDLILRMEARPNGKRYMYVHKSRIPTFENKSTFEFSMPDLIARFGGLDIMTAPMRPVEFASADDVKELLVVVEDVPDRDPKRLIEMWTQKAGVRSLQDMPKEKIRKCIEWCADQIGKAAAKADAAARGEARAADASRRLERE